MNLEKIFVGRDGRQLGTYTIAELRQYVAEGRVVPDDLVWCEGMPAWLPLAAATEIQQALAASAGAVASEPPPLRPEVAYFHIAPWKFIVLSIVTLGIYELYWFYLNWSYVRRRDRSDIWPFWRMVFSPVWCFALCRDVNRHGGSISDGSAVAIAFGYFALSAAAQLWNPWWLIGLFSFAPLVLVVIQIDTINRARGVRAEYYGRFKPVHMALSVFGIVLLALMLFSAFGFLPGTKVMSGSEIPAKDVQFLHAKKIVPENESILYFYSAGILSIREDGNLLTDRQVISYTQVPESDDILAKSATFAEIEDIRVERGRVMVENTRVTIITKEGPKFDLVLPSDGKGDELFVTKLMTLWNKARLEK
jgi:hypothetical protein